MIVLYNELLKLWALVTIFSFTPVMLRKSFWHMPLFLDPLFVDKSAEFKWLAPGHDVSMDKTIWELKLKCFWFIFLCLFDKIHGFQNNWTLPLGP